jgi:hypothetical protein
MVNAHTDARRRRRRRRRFNVGRVPVLNNARAWMVRVRVSSGAYTCLYAMSRNGTTLLYIMKIVPVV